MKLVAVTWTDTVGHPDNDAWMSKDEALDMKPAPMTTVGYLLVQTEEYITVASTKSVDDKDDCFGNVNAIPRACITAVVALCDLNNCESNPQNYFGEKI